MAARQLLFQLSFIFLIILSFSSLSDSVNFSYANSTRKTIDPFDNFIRLIPSVLIRDFTEISPTLIIQYRSPNSSLLNQIPPSPHHQEPVSAPGFSPVPTFDSLLEGFLSNILLKNSSTPEDQGVNSVPGSDSDDQEQLDNGFNGVSQLLKSSGYTTMAAFLDMQLYNGSKDQQRKLTIFAPQDQAVLMNVSEFSSVFRAHIVPKRLLWKDLARINNGTELPTFSGDGYKIRVVRRSFKDGDDVLEFNGVPVIAPDMYDNGSVVVHGVKNLLVSPPRKKIHVPKVSPRYLVWLFVVFLRFFVLAPN